jgi:hypothetical protein
MDRVDVSLEKIDGKDAVEIITQDAVEIITQ